MTSWLRDSPLRVSLGRRRAAPPPLQDVDPAAAFHSFIKHWQQTLDIIERTRLRGQVFADDVTAVINHLAQMSTLLLVDLKQITAHKQSARGSRRKDSHTPQHATKNSNNNNHHYPHHTHHPLEDPHSLDDGSGAPSTASLPADVPPNTPIFDHFLGEEILDKVMDWSLTAGEFVNALKLEQLKVHEQLLSHSQQEVLVYKPIIRPLMKLLASCTSCQHSDVEKRLVVLLNQLCVSLMHNQQLLDFFFQFSEGQGPTKFVIFSLLLPYVHREGGVGQQARDALLLCMALSASHTAVGQYIAQHSHFCPVLATGLSGLYSMLPRSLNLSSEGWHRLTQEDISDIPQLQLFLNSLEFCNAVVQVSHPLVRKQLVEFLYQGFLVPVLGPALNQQSVVSEVVAATAYVELCLRTVTEPDLLRVFLAFLLTTRETSSPTPDPPIITQLISRLHSSNTQLCLVTLSLFWTLVDLNCEDLMLTLVFQYLAPCTHVMVSQRQRLTQPPEPAQRASHKLLHLIPEVCQSDSSHNKMEAISPPGAVPALPQATPPSPGLPPWPADFECLPRPTLYSEYLEEAQAQLASTSAACTAWTWRYDGLEPSPTQAVELLETARANPPAIYPKPRTQSNPEPVQDSPPGGSTKARSSSIPSGMKVCPTEGEEGGQPVVNGSCEGGGSTLPRAVTGLMAEEENLDSLGESSGYESFNIRASRDASPTNSSDGSPRPRPTGAAQGGDSLGRPATTHDDDQDFLETLQRSNTPTEQIGLEETLCEIEQAFSAVRLCPGLSPPSLHNQVFCVEVFSGEEGGGEYESFPWQSHESSPSEVPDRSLQHGQEIQARPTIGPFLEALLMRVDQMLTSSIHVNLLAATLLSRLATFPTPLLTSLLLDATIVFQPAVKSLVQVLSGLKQKIDGVLVGEEAGALVADARVWFTVREVAATPHPSPRTRTPSVSSTSTDTPLMRGETKRRSFSQTVTALFRRPPDRSPTPKENPPRSLQHLPDKAGYRYTKQVSMPSEDILTLPGPAAEKRHCARCAVLVQEWLLELSALAQEQVVAKPYLEFTFPSR
ncbi:FHF complex subunit HOOK interacting protein 1A-like isoform X3 [Eriocheir sinensis]|uniref:FHF complex subunit HOOK interacting protein 1A-like isoform X3 n=1 Tax=Eriocheir sinensis TaxID=95602 RepID=UPI0021C599FA|nr:FHF complex subunit HOOK interacting protein 1A-like isoform X3 [Eriocheir sinensis]